MPRGTQESNKYPEEAALVELLALQIASRGESWEKGNGNP